MSTEAEQLFDQAQDEAQTILEVVNAIINGVYFTDLTDKQQSIYRRYTKTIISKVAARMSGKKD